MNYAFVVNIQILKYVVSLGNNLIKNESFAHYPLLFPHVLCLWALENSAYSVDIKFGILLKNALSEKQVVILTNTF